MIAIVDYKMGNLRSVQNACAALGFDAKVVDSPQALDAASHIILPGVGAFCDAIKCLEKSKMIDPIKKNIKSGKPFLGICLGMQMLFDESFEDGRHTGLGILRGDVVKFDIGKKIPHMGWNDIDIKINSDLYKGLPDKKFYFVHSYYVRPAVETCASICNYGIDFCASVQQENVFGTQFHPEKSGDTGLACLKNFCEMR